MKLEMKKLTMILLFALLTGCSNEGDKSTINNATQKTAAASGIEVSHNENAKEIKVQAKEHDKKDKQYYFDYESDVKAAYSQNATPANPDASIRTKPRTTLDANIHVRSPYERIQVSLLVKGLSKNFIVKCSACHNDYANGIIGPSLLGKDVDFIINKINTFKTDKTANILMTELVQKMDDKEIKEVANDIYRFNNEIKNLRNK
ncbi:MAG: cytochrome c553 [Sulfurimonas sp.]|jgi:cytochrome c553|uniref:c-type cytochrome n=1 Tax=Sulfurimonas sp. TaxID=2022749 RepID=UPI0039E45B93